MPRGPKGEKRESACHNKNPKEYRRERDRDDSGGKHWPLVLAKHRSPISQ